MKISVSVPFNTTDPFACASTSFAENSIAWAGVGGVEETPMSPSLPCKTNFPLASIDLPVVVCVSPLAASIVISPPLTNPSSLICPWSIVGLDVAMFIVPLFVDVILPRLKFFWGLCKNIFFPVAETLSFALSKIDFDDSPISSPAVISIVVFALRTVSLLPIACVTEFSASIFIDVPAVIIEFKRTSLPLTLTCFTALSVLSTSMSSAESKFM